MTDSIAKKPLATTTVASDEPEHTTEVPDYLRASTNDGKVLPRWAWWAVAAALLFGILRVMARLMARIRSPRCLHLELIQSHKTHQRINLIQTKRKKLLRNQQTPVVEPPIANKISPTIPGPNDSANPNWTKLSSA